ncbi:SDR family NAD(P)-dependent oxidoreductase [Intrasporangium sp. YIM S08009]|uniref:SDR family NAD(P)-dependent oxidoreductase n=1 Tax=Intrasporangium zincisolvens TaxID=3080018 RepID=UPI002B053FA2|nr:SDR family NAD(P)-dependent oxidoreductase [Intrasporangium sp. YIM S08009]
MDTAPATTVESTTQFGSTGAPVAVVLGASRGLGLLLARELLGRGHHVVIAARDEDELASAVDQLEPEGEVQGRVCDVRDAAAVGALVGDVEQEVGPIEVLLTVAGIIQVGPARAMALGDFEDAIATMTWGPIHAAMSVLPHMQRRRRGHIGTVTSIGGMVSPPHLLPYATAKFGAVGFSDGLAAALSGSGVTATTVVPGLMRTGSHQRASFSGDAPAEYAWFAPAASLPLLSVDAERAARRIVDGVLAGRPMVVLTPLAWVGIRVRGLAPATTTRVLGLVGRLLPARPERGSRRAVAGLEAARRLASPLVDRLTTFGDRAATQTNQSQPALE